MKRGLCARSLAVFSACATLVSGLARADTPPSVWDIARDPPEGSSWRLHIKVEQLMSQPKREGEGSLDYRLVTERNLVIALSLLQQADAAHSPDVRLQFDLGSVLYELGAAQAREDLYVKALEVLVPALERAPDHPGATDAMERLVYCYVKLNRPEDELAAWRKFIPRLLEDRARAVDMMNMGEAEMRLGHADDAIATFREVEAILAATTNSPVNYILTEWDLAVALDRSGDSRGAIDEASRILANPIFLNPTVRLPMPPSRAARATLILMEDNVFFVPRWELQWYLALANAADGRDASDPRDAARAWGQAELHWQAYVDESASSGQKDPWLAIARIRLAHAHAERLAGESRAAQGAKPASGLPGLPGTSRPRDTLVR
jgi:tetratricopeptide (TPR) repeat protein